jgi:hypothetical protein
MAERVVPWRCQEERASSGEAARQNELEPEARPATPQDGEQGGVWNAPRAIGWWLLWLSFLFRFMSTVALHGKWHYTTVANGWTYFGVQIRRRIRRGEGGTLPSDTPFLRKAGSE